jgi:hypothetical protein
MRYGALGPGAYLVSPVLAQAPGRTGHHQNPPGGTGARASAARSWCRPRLHMKNRQDQIDNPRLRIFGCLLVDFR